MDIAAINQDGSLGFVRVVLLLALASTSINLLLSCLYTCKV